MTRELALKPDFGETADRFAAWWLGELRDRPPVTLAVRPTRPYRGPTKAYASQRDRWLDVEHVVDAAIANLERRDFVGDAFPIFTPNVGPEVSATPFGCELEFGPDTSWSAPVVDDRSGWRDVLARRPDFDNVYWRTIERMTDCAIERCGGRFVVGLPDLHGNYDILASLRDPQRLCEDLIDCPNLVREAGRHVSRTFVELFERSWRRVRAAGFGATCWLPTYHDGPSYVPSCDFWCMISTPMAREFVLPDLRTEMASLQRSIFHLDGPAALRHLDLVLDLPGLHAVQWVYGAGQGPARRWTGVYRRILAAGKGVRLEAETPADALATLEQVGPRGVWLVVEEPFDSVASAEAFLADVGRLSRNMRGTVR